MTICLSRGKSEEFEIATDVDLTNYKIRVEIYDTDTKIRKATSNISGGGIDQIIVDPADNKKFNVFIQNGDTSAMNENAKLEIELESSDGKKLTSYEDDIRIKKTSINWEAITD